jgi:tRNA-specific adenosine deaminase 3
MASLRGGVVEDALTGSFAQLDLGLTRDVDADFDVVPQRGRLVPLKTKDEVRAALETFQAYVIELPSRYAGAIKG